MGDRRADGRDAANFVAGMPSKGDGSAEFRLRPVPAGRVERIGWTSTTLTNLSQLVSGSGDHARSGRSLIPWFT